MKLIGVIGFEEECRIQNAAIIEQLRQVSRGVSNSRDVCHYNPSRYEEIDF